MRQRRRRAAKRATRPWPPLLPLPARRAASRWPIPAIAIHKPTLIFTSNAVFSQMILLSH